MSDDPEMDIVWMKRLREGGHVKRCHALMHNDVGYTDGKHSYDAVSILLVFHPNPSMHLIKAVLWHDVGERYVGDMPASAKFASTVLKYEYEKLESSVIASHFPMVYHALTNLTEEDRQWLAAVDAIEFMLWCQDQARLGNLMIREAFEHIKSHIGRLEDQGKLPEPLSTAMGTGKFHTDRLPERYDQ